MSIIEVKNLSFRYGTAPVLEDLSFSLEKGAYVALAGPNGAGKTTLIKLLLGLETPASGTIRILDQDLKKFSSWEKIGYLPQRVNTFNPLFPATVREVVELGLLAAKRYPKKSSRADLKKISETLELLNIRDLENKPVADLSGGQQQRVFLARALVSNPEILILDEPSTALDPETREQFFAILKKLNTEQGVTVIIITHDTSDIGQYAAELLYLDKQIIFFGLFADFCHSEKMEKYFGHFSHHLICHQHD